MRLAPHVNGIVRLGVRAVELRNSPAGVIAEQQVQIVHAQPFTLRGQRGENACDKMVEILEPESPGDQVAKKALRDSLDSFRRDITVSLIFLK